MKEGIDYAAERLLADLRPLHDLDHWELHLVIDGRGNRMEQHFIDQMRTLSLVYSPAGCSADAILEPWLIRLSPGWAVRVASEDLTIIRTAIAHAAEPLSSKALFHWVDASLSRSQAQLKRIRDKPLNPFGIKLDGL